MSLSKHTALPKMNFGTFSLKPAISSKSAELSIFGSAVAIVL
jgi:hypothetical protein